MNPLFEDEYHARIEPVPPGTKRPLWSVLIPTFNCAGYLRETLASVLEQDPGLEKMEIMVIDDHSTKDDPKAVVDELGGGRVTFIRQDRNVGKVRNYETGLNHSRGVLIHQLHGDDKVEKGFYGAMEGLFQSHSEAGAAFCQAYYINDQGKITGRTGGEQAVDGLLDNWFEKIACGQRIQTPSIVVKRSVYEELGGFDRRLDCNEDWEMWVRIAAYYQFAYTPGNLAFYRSSKDAASYKMLRNGVEFETLRAIIARMDEVFGDKITQKIKKTRSFTQAEYWLIHIPSLIKEKDVALYFRMILEALHYSLSLKTFDRAIRLTVRTLLR